MSSELDRKISRLVHAMDETEAYLTDRFEVLARVLNDPEASTDAQTEALAELELIRRNAAETLRRFLIE
jgi:hypothetical protein